jgi:hypothetical protein
MLRRLAALFLAAHGFAHAVGFLGAFQLGDFAGKPVETSLLWGRFEVSLAVIQALGAGWLILALAFVVVAVAVWRRHPAALSALAVVSVVSLVLTVLQSPMAIVGLVVNVAIIAALVVYGILPARNVDPHRSTPRSGPSLPIR